MGEHKGSGLAFMCELLAGALTGNDCTGPTQRPLTNGMLSIYMARDFFDTDQRFAAELRRYVDFFKGSKPAEPGGEVLVPGEPEQRSRAKRLADGIPLSDAAWRAILEAARGRPEPAANRCRDRVTLMHGPGGAPEGRRFAPCRPSPRAYDANAQRLVRPSPTFGPRIYKKQSRSGAVPTRPRKLAGMCVGLMAKDSGSRRRLASCP
jgi:hypothetical protein